jgi:glycogen synthase
MKMLRLKMNLISRDKVYSTVLPPAPNLPPQQTDTSGALSDNGKTPLSVMYAMGPGDVVGMYRALMDNKEPPFEMSIPFSKLFLDWCDDSGAQAHLISWHTRQDSVRDGRYLLENLPKTSLYYRNGIRHHLGSVMYGFTIIAKVLRERPAVLIVDSGTTHWILLALLSVLRIPVIAVMHSALWPMGFPPKRIVDRLLRSLDGLFFRRFAAATVCVSPECERQVRKVAGTPKGPVYQCRAQYRPGFLSRVKPVQPHLIPPFRILFLGRIGEFKGVFLILSMAERLEKEMPGHFAWKIVGSGPASEALDRQVRERKLGHVVELMDRFPNEQKALETFGWSHAMVVPTTSQFCEGLAMTAAEGVLAGRPVVLSTVVPAWEVLGNAAIKAETDSVDSFVEAFRKLALDPDHYDHCQRATFAPQKQFYDTSQGLGAVLGDAIAALTDPHFEPADLQKAPRTG